MAAPKRNRNKPTDPLFEKNRGKIKTTQLQKRLQHFALGEKDENNHEVKMTRDQIRAANILLKKSVPDLASVQLIGDADQPLETKSTVEVVFVGEKDGKK